MWIFLGTWNKTIDSEARNTLSATLASSLSKRSNKRSFWKDNYNTQILTLILSRCAVKPLNTCKWSPAWFINHFWSLLIQGSVLTDVPFKKTKTKPKPKTNQKTPIVFLFPATEYAHLSLPICGYPCQQNSVIFSCGAI